MNPEQLNALNLRERETPIPEKHDVGKYFIREKLSESAQTVRYLVSPADHETLANVEQFVIEVEKNTMSHDLLNKNEYSLVELGFAEKLTKNKPNRVIFAREEYKYDRGVEHTEPELGTTRVTPYVRDLEEAVDSYAEGEIFQQQARYLGLLADGNTFEQFNRYATENVRAKLGADLETLIAELKVDKHNVVEENFKFREWSHQNIYFAKFATQERAVENLAYFVDLANEGKLPQGKELTDQLNLRFGPGRERDQFYDRLVSMSPEERLHLLEIAGSREVAETAIKEYGLHTKVRGFYEQDNGAQLMRMQIELAKLKIKPEILQMMNNGLRNWDPSTPLESMGPQYKELLEQASGIVGHAKARDPEFWLGIKNFNSDIYEVLANDELRDRIASLNDPIVLKEINAEAMSQAARRLDSGAYQKPASLHDYLGAKGEMHNLNYGSWTDYPKDLGYERSVKQNVSTEADRALDFYYQRHLMEDLVDKSSHAFIDGQIKSLGGHNPLMPFRTITHKNLGVKRPVIDPATQRVTGYQIENLYDSDNKGLSFSTRTSAPEMVRMLNPHYFEPIPEEERVRGLGGKITDAGHAMFWQTKPRSLRVSKVGLMMAKETAQFGAIQTMGLIAKKLHGKGMSGVTVNAALEEKFDKATKGQGTKEKPLTLVGALNGIDDLGYEHQKAQEKKLIRKDLAYFGERPTMWGKIPKSVKVGALAATGGLLAIGTEFMQDAVGG